MTDKQLRYDVIDIASKYAQCDVINITTPRDWAYGPLAMGMEFGYMAEDISSKSPQ